MMEPLWVAGTIAYWAEGAKTNGEVIFANSDPSMIRIFVLWVQRYLGAEPATLRVKLHLHSGQNEKERIDFWAGVTGIPAANFGKTFVKPEGTGHRKKILYNGTASIRVPRGRSAFHRVMGWIDELGRAFWAASSTG